MSKILDVLCMNLPFESRRLISRKVETMLRDFAFIKETKKDTINIVFSKGWSAEKLEVLFSLMSFYQVVIGPLNGLSIQYSKSRKMFESIRYGASVEIDIEMVRVLQGVCNKFKEIVDKFDIGDYVFSISNADDLIYKIARGDGNEGGDENEEGNP